jgi:ribosomal protein S12 methylthiotransferase accessory factor
VSLASVSDPSCHELLAALEAAGLGCGIFNLGSEIEVPVFLCRIVEFRDDGFRPSDLVDGVGCHPCREIALSRAITEAIQIRATAISGSRNDLFRRFYRRPDAAGIAAARASLADPAAGRPFGACPTFAGEAPADDLRHLIARLRPHVKHVIAVDVTHEGAGGVPAVRVLVPELEDGEDMEGYRPRRRAVAAYLGRR